MSHLIETFTQRFEVLLSDTTREIRLGAIEGPECKIEYLTGADLSK
jgi:hypothetical protein